MSSFSIAFCKIGKLCGRIFQCMEHASDIPCSRTALRKYRIPRMNMASQLPCLEALVPVLLPIDDMTLIALVSILHLYKSFLGRKFLMILKLVATANLSAAAHLAQWIRNFAMLMASTMVGSIYRHPVPLLFSPKFHLFYFPILRHTACTPLSTRLCRQPLLNCPFSGAL